MFEYFYGKRMILMIIREQNDAFIMIKQHDHAQISKKLYQQLHNHLLPKESFSLEYAIAQHDCGWIPFDEAPFWNDQQQSPFSFTNYPTEPKTVLYEYGINLIEENDLYAALLCSEHYTRFLNNSSNASATGFVERERARQKRIKDQLNTKEALFLKHYEILQFFDNLSLYICLNEPGTAKEDEHYFFKKGIKLPHIFAENQILTPNWKTDKIIELNKNLFTSSFPISLKQKVVSKQSIIEQGLQEAYSNTNTEEILLYVS